MMVRGAEFSLFLAEDPANNLAENVILKDVMNLRGSVERPLHVLELGAYEGATSSWISEFMVRVSCALQLPPAKRHPTLFRLGCSYPGYTPIKISILPAHRSYSTASSSHSTSPLKAGQPPQLVPLVH
jgi:hypothetical protein